VTTDELQRLMEALDEPQGFLRGKRPRDLRARPRPPSSARGNRRLGRCERAVRGLLEQAQSRSRHSGPLTRGARTRGRPPFVGDLLAYADI